MLHDVRIALDAMGGDHGAAVVVPGAERSLMRRPDIKFVLFGDRAVLEPLIDARPRLKAAARLVHTDVAIKMDAKPSQALRQGRWKSSMWLAIDAVKKGEADVAVSAGNTGALMAMAKFHLKTMAGIERPAIAALWPTLKGFSVVLDLGATIGADARHLVDMATMGSAMARVLFGRERPSVGLLNIGVEEVKGLEPVREAGRILREGRLAHLDYYGFVEGDDIGKGTVDVVVTEGFAGNIALKTAEGTARQFAQCPKTSGPSSAMCSRAMPSARLPTRWTRASRTAASFSASTASSSRATAVSTPKASPTRSISATTWSATSSWPKSASR